jgi:hypothetical protein
MGPMKWVSRASPSIYEDENNINTVKVAAGEISRRFAAAQQGKTLEW